MARLSHQRDGLVAGADKDGVAVRGFEREELRLHEILGSTNELSERGMGWEDGVGRSAAAFKGGVRRAHFLRGAGEAAADLWKKSETLRMRVCIYFLSYEDANCRASIKECNEAPSTSQRASL